MTQGIIVGILFLAAIFFMARKLFFKGSDTEATCEKCAPSSSKLAKGE